MKHIGLKELNLLKNDLHLIEGLRVDYLYGKRYGNILFCYMTKLRVNFARSN